MNIRRAALNPSEIVKLPIWEDYSHIKNKQNRIKHIMMQVNMEKRNKEKRRETKDDER